MTIHLSFLLNPPRPQHNNIINFQQFKEISLIRHCVLVVMTTSDTVANTIGLVMSGVFIIFICTRLFFVWLRRFQSRPRFNVHATLDNANHVYIYVSTIELKHFGSRDIPYLVLQAQHPLDHGLEPVLVAEIPTTKFCRDTFEDAQWVTSQNKLGVNEYWREIHVQKL